MPLGSISEKQKPSTAPHIPALDGIRGLAILMVIVSHAFESNFDAGGALIRFSGQLMYYGAFGVDLFFVLSGFLITGILVDSLGDRGFFRTFYARRALRIFPLYYGVLLVCLLLTRPLHLHWQGMGWLLVFYLQTLKPAVIVTFSPGGGLALYHFWSLAVEEQFYLVWPALVYFVRDRGRLLSLTLWCSAGALLLRLGLLSVGASGFAIHVSTICRMDSLLLGGALALLYRSNHWTKVQQVALPTLMVTAVLVVASTVWLDPYVALHPMGGVVWREGFRYTFLAVCFASLIACTLRRQSKLERLFTFGGLRWLGKYSYGIYVLHVFALSLLLPWLRALILSWTQSKALAVGGAGVLALGVAIVGAYGSYHLYEKPFLRLKRRFEYSNDRLNHASPEEAEREADGAGGLPALP